jgi:hypothetical protein
LNLIEHDLTDLGATIRILEKTQPRRRGIKHAGGDPNR